MTYNPHKLGSDDAEAAKLMHDFFEDCGGDPQFQLSCFNEETKEAEVIPLEKPYLLVGRSNECELCFRHREVSYRHAYLQLLKERLLVVDLGSRTGTSWKGNRRRSGWLLPGREVKFGPHIVKLVRLNKFEDDYPQEGDSNLELKEVIAKGQPDATSRSFPHATLELLSVNSKSPTGKTLVLKPGVTLIGRSRVAQIRLKHDSVSHVHSSLVLTENGLWVIDLLGRGGTYVNDEQVEFALLQRDDVISVGAFHLRVETGRVKPLSGKARAQLKNPLPSRHSGEDQSTVNGVRPASEEEDLSTKHIQSIQPEEDTAEVEPAKSPEAAQQPDEEQHDPESVLSEHEKDNEQSADQKEGTSEGSSVISSDDPTRWGEIIDALKSGGFGT
jgi:pSer/pThr/pTyr-binding forkhead associated (FHA) protein